MKTDFYTKAILTVIAANLSWLAVKDFVPAATAGQSALQRVVICNLTGERCATVARVQTKSNPELDALMVVDLLAN